MKNFFSNTLSGLVSGIVVLILGYVFFTNNLVSINQPKDKPIPVYNAFSLRAGKDVFEDTLSFEERLDREKIKLEWQMDSIKKQKIKEINTHIDSIYNKKIAEMETKMNLNHIEKPLASKKKESSRKPQQDKPEVEKKASKAEVAKENNENDERSFQKPDFNGYYHKIERVVIAVCVNDKGEIIEADYTQRGSTTHDASLKKRAIDNAKLWKFEKSNIVKQCGTISFEFGPDK